MILESLVTTMDDSAAVNLAPMGPIVKNPDAMSRQGDGDPLFLLRPFEGSRTCENLLSTRRATIHVSDDANLFAKAVIGTLPPIEPLIERRELEIDSKVLTWATLRHCHRWFAVEILSVTKHGPKHEMPCRLVASGIDAPFFGFNRAKHAVIEAAILATRTHLIDPSEINQQLAKLAPLIEKTAGRSEQSAFEELCVEISRRLESKAPDRPTERSAT